ncbi:MAG: 2-C-methyl-D-erythritol 2,4-cyclodiphosphate synthase, partial [Sutterella sp.]|nr:2-C-methyl-D-erythritol 2,4-cyclodiphosphate synthase [Sutterella sp.]
LFPDTDAAYLGANSLQLLKDVVRRVREVGWRVGNLDAVLITEAPKINPHVAKIEATLAATLGVNPADVSVKPKTNEKLGFEGRGEGMSAQATVLLERIEA